MTNQPNTEDGNEWLDNIMCNITYDGCYQPDGLEEAKDEIQAYIQSNYILKSDVEGIIKQSKPVDSIEDEYSLGWNAATEKYEQNLIKKASQYGLGDKK